MTCSFLCSWVQVLIAAAIGSAPTAAQGPETIAISGGTVFDSVQGVMLADRTVFIDGDRIRAVGTPERPLSIPEGTRIIDARGKYVIPGLIDAHVHLVHVLNSAHVTGDEVLPLFLANGVTTLRDTGDEIVAERLVARYAASHPERCPRVFLCSPLIDADPPTHRDIGRAVVDPDQVPALIDEMDAWGVATLKIYAGTARSVGRKVIEEGHRHGKIVTAHLGNYSAQDAVADGVDCLEHIWSVFNFIIPSDVSTLPNHRANLDLNNSIARELVGNLVERQVMVDPTLVVFRNMILLSDLEEIYRHPDNLHVPERLMKHWTNYRLQANLPPDTREMRRREFRKYQDLTGILYRAGVPLLAGTDSPEPFVPPGFSMHQELQLLVDSGLTPAAALQAATIHNARALKQAEQFGSIDAGKLADLVIVDADPLADIRNTRKVSVVIRAGRVCDPRTLLQAVSVE